MIRLFSVLVFAASLVGGQPAQSADGKVTLTSKDNMIEITIGGESFGTYHFARTLPKPFLMPAKAPGNVTITRSLEKPADHPHHKGIWCSVDEVNGIKFWAEKGKIENVSAKPLVAEGNPARIQVVNSWLGEDGKPLLIETTVISIYSNRLLSYDMTFTAPAVPVTLEDTKEGMFGIRLIDALREKETGKVLNAEGLKGTKEAWGKPSAWVDYHGQVDGKTVGVAIFDHPKNFRPSRYHVRDYGLFTISPFGEKSYTNGAQDAKPLTLKSGDKLSLKYGIYLHAGDAAEGKVADAYAQFVKAE